MCQREVRGGRTSAGCCTTFRIDAQESPPRPVHHFSEEVDNAFNCGGESHVEVESGEGERLLLLSLPPTHGE